MKTGIIPALLLTLALMTGHIFAKVSVTATTGMLGPSNYTTLKGAFEAINAGNHQATVTVAILGNTTETAPAVLNASGSGLASYISVSISPSSGAARTIIGSVFNGALIKFNGADNVTLYGSLNGTTSRDLTIKNTATTGSEGDRLAELGCRSGGDP